MTKTEDRPARATIATVAKQAGVAKSTVSRVVNGKGGVTSSTEARVLRAITKLGYSPDPVAQELSRGRILQIGLNEAYGNRRLIPYAMLFRDYFAKGLASSGFRITDVPSKPDGLPEHLADALVLTGVYDEDPRLSYLRTAGIPFVVMGKVEGERWVCPDDFDGGRQAGDHLMKLGHRKVLVVMGEKRPSDLLSASYPKHGDAQRLQGFRAALEPYKDAEFYVARCDFTTLGAFLAVQRALKTHDFTGVFALTDEMAVGVVRAVEEQGYRVPGDVSVVGFDDMPELGGALTTVRQDIREIAATTVVLLREALEGTPARGVQVPVRLVARHTTARR